MSGDADRLAAELPGLVEQHLAPGESCGYVGWVSRTGARRVPQGSLASVLGSWLPEHTTAMVLAVTSDRLLLLREPPPAHEPGAGGLRGWLDGFREEVNGLVSSRPVVLRPVASLEVVWQAARSSVSRAEAKRGAFADRVVLDFADGSRISLIAPDAGRLAAALAPH